MKKIILMALFIFCFSTPLYAANFVEVYRDDNILIALDTSSIEKRDDYIVAWTKWIPRGETKTKHEKKLKTKISHYMEFTAYNLTLKQFQFLMRVYYSPKNSVIDSYSENFAMYRYKDVIPDSIGYLLYDLVIDYYNQE